MVARGTGHKRKWNAKRKNFVVKIFRSISNCQLLWNTMPPKSIKTNGCRQIGLGMSSSSAPSPRSTTCSREPRDLALPSKLSFAPYPNELCLLYEIIKRTQHYPPSYPLFLILINERNQHYPSSYLLFLVLIY